MDKHSLVLYFMSMLFMTTALKIRNIIVPPTISLSNEDAIVLDCDYDVGNDSSNLVVKWFHNDLPIYQWIFNHSHAEMGIFRGKLDLSYKSTNSVLTEFRGIKIKEPSMELSGVYKCVVFNYVEEDSMSKRMVVINKPSKLLIEKVDVDIDDNDDNNDDDDDDDSISIACSAYDVFPEPHLNISFSGSNEFDNVINEPVTTQDGLFNVTQIVTVKADMLANITDFVCELTIPETDYYLAKRLTFVPGSVTTEPALEQSDHLVSESSYIEDKASPLAPVWMLLLVATMATLLST